MFEPFCLPMRRYLPNPLHARIFHRHRGVEATGNGILNQDLFALFKQGDLFFFNGNGLIDLRGFAIEEVGDGGLFS